MLVLLYVIDCLRHDFLRCFDGDKNFPHFQSVMKDSVTYTNAYSVSSWTKGAADAILTSQYPMTLGVLFKESCMPEYTNTLQDVLKHNGFRCFAVSANAFFSEQFGHTGFDQFHLLQEPYKTSVKYAQRYILPSIERARDTNLFLMNWLCDMHAPYSLDILEKFCDCKQARNIVSSNDLAKKFNLGQIKQMYREAIRSFDCFLGEVITRLKQMHIYESSLIIITADHGTAFGEHKRLSGKPDIFHAGMPFEEKIRIPMIVKYPKNNYAGIEINRPVQLIDIYPTILDVCGIPTRGNIEGISLSPKNEIDEEGTRVIFVKYASKKYTMSAIRKGVYKLIKVEFKINFIKDAFKELIHKILYSTFGSASQFYNLKDDPGEKVNLYKEEKPQANILLSELETIERKCQLKSQAFNKRTVDELDEDTLRRLKALGYM